LLSASEQRQLLQEWSGAAVEAKAQECVHEMFRAQALRDPKALAVLCGRQRVTYGELLQSVDTLKGGLEQLGIGPEAQVGLMAEPSVERLVGLLAVLEVGAAYVPIDPDQPRKPRRWPVPGQ
jgi:non-ribosomal peptide synthetase component F